jgi:hypothetical protein
MKRVFRNALVWLGVFAVGSLIWSDPWMCLSVLLGGAVATVNFRWMQGGVERVLLKPGQIGTKRVLIKYVGRLVLLFGAVFAIIHFSFLSIYGALLGLSVFVLSGMQEAVYLLRKPRAGMR